MINIIFVKHGDKYSAEHVNVLHKQLLVYYPAANYYCYTDDPVGVSIPIIPIFKKPSLRKWWNKLALFSEAMPFKGKCLYFDLDTVVISDPTSYIKNFDGLTILEAYWKVGNPKFSIPHAYDVLINSSIITWTAGEQTHIWKHFLTNQDYFMRKYKGIDRFIVHENMPHKTFAAGLINSMGNKPDTRVSTINGYKTPINIYNGIDYELQNRTI